MFDYENVHLQPISYEFPANTYIHTWKKIIDSSDKKYIFYSDTFPYNYPIHSTQL